MDQTNKIIIGVVIVLIIVILVGGYFVFQLQRQIEESKQQNETSQNQIEEPKEKNEVQNQVIENTVSSPQTNTNQTNEQNQSQQPSESSGKEEQESKQENQGENLDQKAINLAKKEWGTNAESYSFVIDSKQGSQYTIAVRSANVNAVTTIAYYEVNVETGEVKEQS